ncbi:ABC transporter substrate-binding protein [Thermosulfurimonas dismutans]|uniref:Branched-chain amino acid ABC transporter, amino acid-binding protein n=1 Tax=Thermosulfurimonas dismutans TaxID=999894 RepID=A0A179D561_9BACT|nr:ABC transporter substrate-binding protein [Thermosulfurimonas dismutans]OAQ21225.1 Branched-chain amino acid ABC transporter, amino acid-binding protein [Thermosulfurimonas dismutans]
MRKIALLFLLGIFLFLFSFQALAKEPYRIGALFSVTGPTSFIGDPEKKTLEMLVDEINKAGGINGHPLKLYLYDTQGDETLTVKKFVRLVVQDKVLAVIGPSRTGTSLAVAPLAERYRVPLISCAAGIKIVEPVKPYVFKTAQSDRLAVKKIYAYCVRQGIKKVAILTVSNGFGQSGRQELKRLAPQYGIEIVADELFGPKDVDMKPQLIKIRKTEAQAIICWGTNPGPAIVAKNMRELGMKQKLFMSHGVASKRFIELAGEAAEGIILPAGKLIVANELPDSDPQKALLLSYIERYKARYGKAPSSFGGHAYDAFLLLKEALIKAGADKAKIREALENIKGLKGIHGVFNMTPQDHNGLSEKEAFVLVEIRGGDFHLLKE